MSSKLPDLTTTSYAILGLLTIKPWSTYELAKQMQRDRFVWPRAESNLVAEPKKLIAHGFASAHSEPRGKRRRTVYSITPAGKLALADWLGKPAAEPRWEAESMVKFTFATGGSKEQLLANLRDFRRHATVRWEAVEAIFRPYLEGNEPFPTERISTSSREDSSLRPHASKLSGQTGRSKRSRNGTRPPNPRITRQRSPR